MFRDVEAVIFSDLLCFRQSIMNEALSEYYFLVEPSQRNARTSKTRLNCASGAVHFFGSGTGSSAWWHNTKGLFVVFGGIPCCSRHIMRQALPLKEASKATQRRKQRHPAWKDKDKGKVEGKQYQHGSENPTTELPVTALSIPMWVMWANASSARAGQLPTPQQISQSLPHDRWLK